MWYQQFCRAVLPPSLMVLFLLFFHRSLLLWKNRSKFNARFTPPKTEYLILRPVNDLDLQFFITFRSKQPIFPPYIIPNGSYRMKEKKNLVIFSLTYDNIFHAILLLIKNIHCFPKIFLIRWIFQTDKYLSVSKRLDLSRSLNLTEVQIKTWWEFSSNIARIANAVQCHN